MILNQFFELLRSGLWEKPVNASLFDGNDSGWDAIYRLSQEQTVIALVFDGINTLPPQLRPPRALYMQWCAQVARIEEANELLDSVVAELFPVFREAGIPAVLLKGQGMAANYPNPNHRQCGDIDIYTGEENYRTANELMTKNGGILESEYTIKHAAFLYKGVSVEIHRTLGSLNYPGAKRTLAKFTSKWPDRHTDTILIAGNKTPVPSPTVNTIYIFTHAFHHFLNSGIGLRQVCDWAKLIDAHYKEIDPTEIQSLLKKMKLSKAIGAFAYIAVSYLGLAGEKVPFPIAGSSPNGEELLADILTTGNFGQFNTKIKKRPKGYWAGKWHTFSRVVTRIRKLRRHAPSEVYWYPLALIQGNIVVHWDKLMARIKK